MAKRCSDQRSDDAEGLKRTLLAALLQAAIRELLDVIFRSPWKGGPF